jgi:hypothetical protein
LKKKALSQANNNKQRRCLGGNPMGVSFLILTFIFWLFLPFLCISPYIGDNVSFKCGGGDLGCVLICFLLKEKNKKKRSFTFCFVVFHNLGFVCHEQDSIKLEKFIT